MFQKIQHIVFSSIICFTVVACGGNDETANKSPTLSIQTASEANELSAVNLAVIAIDSDGSISSYLWQQTSGTEVALLGENSNNASFIVPEISADETLTFSLTVQDNDGGVVHETFSMLVRNINKLPTLSIQAPFEANELTRVDLVATANDSDGAIIGFDWQQTAGPVVNISDNSQAALSFVLPDVAIDQTLTFSMTVTDNEGGQTKQEISFLVNALTLAQSTSLSDVNIIENDNNISIFISELDIQVDESLLESVAFTVLSKPGTVAAPIHASYAIKKLAKTENGIKLPIYGLYRSYNNQLELAFTFIDGSIKTLTTTVATEINLEPTDNPFNNYKITTPLANSVTPSYDYILMKSAGQGPVIMDVDGNVRWQAYLKDAELYTGFSSLFDNGVFKVALADKLFSLHLDGTVSSVVINHDELTDIAAHHELSKGKTGYLVEIDANKSGVSARNIESILLEVDDNGDVIKTWDFAVIFSDYLIKNGDQASNFVRNGSDWFHMNSAIYSAVDNSLIVSSRENFVVKIDYDNNEIKWLLGDESKHWYVNYPSLRVLSLTSVDTKPIGQHALSLADGELLLFNDGQKSFNQPEGEPAGLALTTSPSASYVIDEDAMLASVAWSYDADIYSDVCSSIYKDSLATDGDYLINFAAVNRLNADPVATIIQAVTENNELLFEFQFETDKPCQAAWNSSIAYGLTNLQFN